MFLWETIEKRASITGVFRRYEEACEFWDSMSNENQKRNEGLKHEIEHYPFYIVEFEIPSEQQKIFNGSVNGFHFCTETDVVQELKEIERRKLEEGESYLTIYAISGDWEGNPNNPGTDYMGALPHTHVDDAFLDTHGSESRPWKVA